MNGYQSVFIARANKNIEYKEYIFTLFSGEDEISINSDDLKYFGISVEFINQCTVKLKNGDLSRLVYCSPKIINKSVAQHERQLDVI